MLATPHPCALPTLRTMEFTLTPTLCVSPHRGRWSPQGCLSSCSRPFRGTWSILLLYPSSKLVFDLWPSLFEHLSRDTVVVNAISLSCLLRIDIEDKEYWLGIASCPPLSKASSLQGIQTPAPSPLVSLSPALYLVLLASSGSQGLCQCRRAECGQ